MTNRLLTRLILPVAAFTLLVFAGLSLLALDEFNRFAADRVERSLEGSGKVAFETLDDIYDRLLLSGKLDSPAEVRVLKARALDRLERFFLRNGLSGLVLDESGQALLVVDLPNPGGLPATTLPEHKATPVLLDGRAVFAYRTDFPPLGWRVILVDSLGELNALGLGVGRLYWGAGGLLALALAAFCLISRRVVSRPVARIVEALERGERPDYRGIAEFTFLSEAIGRLMDTLETRDRQRRLDQLWYRQMFELAPALMFTVDAQLAILEANRRFCAHTGYESGEIKGLPADKLFAFAGRDLSAVAEGRPVNDAPAALRTAAGEVRQMLVDALPATSPAGQMFGLVVVRDITLRLKAERDMLAAREAAEEGNRAKSEFLANVSHEIRTPLNGVLGMLQLLDKTPVTHRQRGYIAAALETGRALMALLGDILNFSSLEAGRAALVEEPFSPAGILAEMVQLFASQARDRNVTITVQVDPAVPTTLVGDCAGLRQVLFNLVGNAVKFTPSGSVFLAVAALPPGGAATAGRLFFTVEDTGIGIHADRLARLFEPFTQADASKTRRFQGAGLGLAIVKRLIHQWGTALDVDSRPGQGTTICFTMPVRPAPASAKPALPAAAPGPFQTSGGRVLLAEDDPMNTVATMDMLESLGYRATIVDNGRDALRALTQENFDCLLLDVQMPELDGMATVKAIRGSVDLGAMADIPIVALAAHVGPGDRERYLAAGMNDCLAKPVDFADLAGVLWRVLTVSRHGPMG